MEPRGLLDRSLPKEADSDAWAAEATNMKAASKLWNSFRWPGEAGFEGDQPAEVIQAGIGAGDIA